jgi:hypothetical protein
VIYKLQIFNEVESVNRITDKLIAYIPFDPANTDYQTFKRDLSEGVELQDPDGNVMTQEQVDEFLRTLP